MNFKKLLYDLFASNDPPQKRLEKKLQRLYVKDIQAGDIVTVEWSRIRGGIGGLKCLNNDPVTKKILFETNWNNYIEMGVPQHQKIIFDYNGEELKNFHLLNQAMERRQEVEDDYDMASLQKNMNEALEKEEYEKAEELQKKINKILHKPK